MNLRYSAIKLIAPDGTKSETKNSRKQYYIDFPKRFEFFTSVVTVHEMIEAVKKSMAYINKHKTDSQRNGNLFENIRIQNTAQGSVCKRKSAAAYRDDRCKNTKNGDKLLLYAIGFVFKFFLKIPGFLVQIVIIPA